MSNLVCIFDDNLDCEASNNEHWRPFISYPQAVVILPSIYKCSFRFRTLKNSKLFLLLGRLHLASPLIEVLIRLLESALTYRSLAVCMKS